MGNAAPIGKRRVLVVEDDVAIAEMIVQALSKRGYEVEMVHDGESALARAEQFKPALILLDVMLPKLDGFAVAKRLKSVEALKGIPVVFLTAKDNPRDVIQGIQSGAKYYITKPFKLDDLASKVKKLIK
jgi:DNA-binding response OmpR family regulator